LIGSVIGGKGTAEVDLTHLCMGSPCIEYQVYLHFVAKPFAMLPRTPNLTDTVSDRDTEVLFHDQFPGNFHPTPCIDIYPPIPGGSLLNTVLSEAVANCELTWTLDRGSTKREHMVVW
jgi:hypothetical protein